MREATIAAAVRNAKTPGLYGDGHGLYLQVSVFKTKSWVFRFMIDGQARKMGLGPLHTISLAEARAEALEARKLVRKGIDPIEGEHARRAALKAASSKVVTFKQCADQYIAAHSAGWRSAKHREQWRATFNETKRGSKEIPGPDCADQ